MLSKKEIETLSKFTDDQILEEMSAHGEKQFINFELVDYSIQQMRVFIARRKEFVTRPKGV